MISTFKPPLYPLLLVPSLHRKVWGGRKLFTEMNKPLPDDAPYGEAWELHDTSTVANGPLAGRPLSELITTYEADLIGDNPLDEGLPLLAKLLDADDWLSVQVHPDDAQARDLEGDPRGKTEAWIILRAEPDAKLVIGVKPGTSRETMAQAIHDQQLEDYIVYAPVKAGDVLYVRANTVHAIGPGILLYEIQQSSNITYRLYDWGRMGLDGKPRELHIDKGVQVANVESVPDIQSAQPQQAIETLVDSDYFKTVRYRLDDDTHHIDTHGRFHALTCVEGHLTVMQDGQSVVFTTGQTVMIPASLPDYTLSGTGVVLLSHQAVDASLKS